MSVKAMKAGAVDFLAKPFRDQDLLDAIAAAIERDRKKRETSRESNIQSHFESLTPREREVLHLVAAGRLNKQIAGDLGISDATVKVHGGQIMRKMKAGSLAELVRICAGPLETVALGGGADPTGAF